MSGGKLMYVVGIPIKSYLIHQPSLVGLNWIKIDPVVHKIKLTPPNHPWVNGFSLHTSTKKNSWRKRVVERPLVISSRVQATTKLVFTILISFRGMKPSHCQDTSNDSKWGKKSQQNLLCLSHWSSLNLICSCLSLKVSKHHHFKEQNCPLWYYWESHQWHLVLPGKIALFHRFYSILTLAAKYHAIYFFKKNSRNIYASYPDKLH